MCSAFSVDFLCGLFKYFDRRQKPPVSQQRSKESFAGGPLQQVYIARKASSPNQLLFTQTDS